MFEATLNLTDPRIALVLLGTQDQHLKTIRRHLQVSITHQDGRIRIAGEQQPAVSQAAEALEQLKKRAERQQSLASEEVARTLAEITGEEVPLEQTTIDVVHTNKTVVPRTPGQKDYVESMRRHDVVFSLGPAGCGKTYLAVAAAVEALKHHQIRKIVLVRPAVEAGESLGFLPGDMQAKINPYLRPLLDALNEMMDHDQIKRYMEMDVIEVAPLAYMRGRTLNEAFMILDEAQNTTIAQMKMFLTRMGAGSKIVVAGDPTQTDLPGTVRSGLRDAVARLQPIPGVGIARLSEKDIVRHRLVQEIVQAYEATENKKKTRRSDKSDRVFE